MSIFLSLNNSNFNKTYLKMKKLLVLLPLNIFMIFTLSAQPKQGTVIESIILKSSILKKEMKLNIYLPPNYDTSQSRYPVVFLLHGMGQNYMDWVKQGNAKRTTDSLIALKAMPDMIFVNSAEGYNYEDYFFKELIPYVDSTYKTKPSRDFRAIAGLSMGGYGSILYSLKHGNVFSACVGLSSGIVTDEEIVNIPDNMWDAYYAPLFGKAKGNDRLLLENWKINNTLSLIQIGKRKDLMQTKWYLDIGDDDSLYKGNTALHVLMCDKRIPHEFRMRDGAHTWDYWRTGLSDALKFVGQSLKH
jgi:enterochelin esterase-like enzyme